MNQWLNKKGKVLMWMSPYKHDSVYPKDNLDNEMHLQAMHSYAQNI